MLAKWQRESSEPAFRKMLEEIVGHRIESVTSTAISVQGKWQSIETAPKHARAIVCGGIRNVVDGYHDVQSAWIDGCGNVWADDRKEGSAPIRPTHWMPLPDTPR